MGNAKSVGGIKDVKDDPAKRKPKLSQSERKISPSHKKMSRKMNSVDSKASMSSQGNRRPVLTANQRAIIKYCIDNAKDDIADRIIRRATEKRDDFKGFLDNLPRAQRAEVSDALRVFLNGVCENLTDSEEIQRMSEEFGAFHVPFRTYSFKPDFFACTADAVTTECTFLDQATHTPSETAGAWSTLSAFVFSAVRDGYYAELRRQRKSSSAFRNRPSVDVSSDGSVADGGSRRSVSPTPDELSQSSGPKETANYLLPPQVY